LTLSNEFHWADNRPPSQLNIQLKQTMNNSHELYRDFFITLEQLGGKTLPDEQCCQLLAWLLVYGGGCELTTTNFKLNTDIQCAQMRLNIFGGEIPNGELIPLLQKFITECEQYESNEIDKPQWLDALEKRHGLTK
jgi:hypothetical protein